MNATDSLVLPADVVLVSAASFSPAMFVRMGAAEGDVVISRRGSRSRSVVLDSEGAAFVEQFRSPATIVDAVLRHAGRTGEAPEQVLETAGPLVARLLTQQLIIVEGQTAGPIEPTLARDAVVGGMTVLDCVHLFEDVEVYRCRDQSGTNVALKILRPQATSSSRAMLERESAILDRLAGAFTPALRSTGVMDDRPYLVQSWCDGVPATRAASTLRSGSADPFPHDLLALCIDILRAYAALHVRGIVHGDVHPGNVRVGAGATVTLLDFGLSWCMAAALRLPPPRRGGLPEYFEPEYCTAIRRGETPPPASAASDQYAVGSLVYALITGFPCQDFSLERDAWLQQVAEGSPLPFSARGHAAWPELEAVLGRALNVDARLRFPSVKDFLQEFVRVASSCPLPAIARSPSGRCFLDDLVARLSPNDASAISRVMSDHNAPCSSINYGAGGIAWMFYRLASLRGEARLLSDADVWCTRGLRHASQTAAFACPEIGIAPELTGPMSPFHTVSGLHLVDALVKRAMGDLSAADRASQAFVEATSTIGSNPDLTLGWAGGILGCASLTEALSGEDTALREIVVGLGDRLAATLVDWMTERTITGNGEMHWLGLAHGWAGLLLALMRWTEATGAPFPRMASDRLDELTSLGHRNGDELWWPVETDRGWRGRMALSGWCHGSAGHLLLWILAYRLFRDESYLLNARGAANHLSAAHGGERHVNGSLCCGFAGQGYAMLSFHRLTGDGLALETARVFGERAIALASESSRRDSLYKGDVGIALLVEELEHPPFASMPLIETEGWPPLQR
jgi:serine/threonine-protein kinase